MTKELKEKLIAVLDKQSEAREYLKATDYIVIKLAEASLNGEDLTELKTTYAEQLAKRKEYRASIDTLQAELIALNEELKVSEEAKNDGSTEDVIEQPVEETITEKPIEETPAEQPVEEIPSDNSEVVEKIPAEVDTTNQPTNTPTEEVTEVDTTNQTSDNISDITNTTNTSESVEVQPIDTTENTTTEETPITEKII